MAQSGSEFEELLPNAHAQTKMYLSLTSRYLLARTYLCAAELVTWGVGPDVFIPGIISSGLKQTRQNRGSENPISLAMTDPQLILNTTPSQNWWCCNLEESHMAD